jgi:hypothetical protein
MANAAASAGASVQRQTEAVKDSTAMIRAQRDGTESITAAQIAYKNARESGASVEESIALKQAVLINGLEKEAAAFDQANKSAAQAADSIALAGYNAEQAASKMGTFNPSVMPSGPHSFSADPNLNVSYKGGGRGFNMDVGADLIATQQLMATQNDPSNIANSFVGRGNYAGGISAIEKLQGNDEARMSQVDTLTQLLNNQTSDKGTQLQNLQKEMAWLNTLPETIARDQKIVDLKQSMDQLKNSTDANTSATQATLNPLYSQGHGALAIGYYKAAADWT